VLLQKKPEADLSELPINGFLNRVNSSIYINDNIKTLKLPYTIRRNEKLLTKAHQVFIEEAQKLGRHVKLF
jgi:hypothetical protein